MTTKRHNNFIVSDFRPAYLAPGMRHELPKRAAAARGILAHCHLCPRACEVDRIAGHNGVCHTGHAALVTSAFPHLGEENCLRGQRGSGTIFFARCNLGCVFCQNWDISQRPGGEPVDDDTLADIMLAMQEQGCHNINLVTPSHVVPQIIAALNRAIGHGLHLPVVYNSSAYDSIEALRLLEGLVDIYMPDFKFWTNESARHLAHAPDYPEIARAALAEMNRQVGVLKFTPDGLACRGVLVRHLVMPGQLDQTRAIMSWLANALSPDTYVNLMPQYHPDHEVPADATGRSVDLPAPYLAIARRPALSEIRQACRDARKAGLWRFDERLLPSI